MSSGESALRAYTHTLLCKRQSTSMWRKYAPDLPVRTQGCEIILETRRQQRKPNHPRLGTIYGTKNKLNDHQPAGNLPSFFSAIKADIRCTYPSFRFARCAICFQAAKNETTQDSNNTLKGRSEQAQEGHAT